MNPIRSILFLAFPNAGEQDLLAPWELLKSVAWSLGARGEKLEVSLGSFAGGVVTTQMGAKLEMERKIEATDRYDLVYVPGGIGAGQLSQNPEVLAFLRAHHREGRWVAANCAGVGVLHRAGILAGAQVTSPATLARSLPAQGTPVAAILAAPGRSTPDVGSSPLVVLPPCTPGRSQQQARELAAGWDTLPLHGEALFSRLGPEMRDDPDPARRLYSSALASK